MLSCTKVSDTGICLKCKSKTIIINAFYRKPDLTNPDTNSYNESLSYDKNGNITALQRTGEFDDSYYNLTIDNLTYNYNSVNPNQLDKVDDSTNNPNGFKDGTNTSKDYTYDDYGNMKTDGNKEIYDIRYNHLNLPTNIETSQGKISYLYNAVGVKLMKNVLSTNPTLITDYLDGFQYLNSVLEFFPHAEGYVKNTILQGVNSYNYVFNYTDHLGNIRLSYGIGEGNDLKIFEEINYYPFGLSHKNYNMDQRTYQSFLGQTVRVCNSCPTGYNYKYNGKELQDELGLNMYDYGARNYDPALGRWMNIDPLAEDGRRWSPYNYAMNNPVYFLDPDGMLSQGFMDKIMNASSGTTFTNNGNGTFSSNGGETVDNDGNAVDGNVGAEANNSQEPPKGKKVLEAKKSLLGKIWFTLEPREWTDPNTGIVYQVNADGTIKGIRPLGGMGVLGFVSGGGAMKVVSLVKSDTQLLKLARETFKSNSTLSKEASGLTEALSKGNLNPGIGTKNIVRNIFEARSKGGARVYFRTVGDKIEILGYSSKANQQAVIDRIIKLY